MIEDPVDSRCMIDDTGIHHLPAFLYKRPSFLTLSTLQFRQSYRKHLQVKLDPGLMLNTLLFINKCYWVIQYVPGTLVCIKLSSSSTHPLKLIQYTRLWKWIVSSNTQDKPSGVGCEAHHSIEIVFCDHHKGYRST